MRRRLAALLCASALLVTTACAADDNGDDNGPGDDPNGMDVISVGVIPIVDVAPLFLGIEQGFFAAQNIEIETDTAAGGAEIVPGVVSGQWDFGFSNILSMMIAHNTGIDIQVISNGNNSTGVDGEDFGSLVVPVDSPVQSASELEGATVAINTLNAIADIVVRASVLADGGDPDTINFVALPFPEMPAAIESGDVDAAFPVEPFQTIIRENGWGRSIASSWVDTAPNLTVAVYFTSGSLIEENPDLVDRFVTAMAQSLAYANENPDEVRAIIPTYTAITPELAAILTLPAWPPEINLASTQRLAERALDAGLLDATPDLDALVNERVPVLP
jgi:NitT/TauT family transport system substrate-binding protein